MSNRKKSTFKLSSDEKMLSSTFNKGEWKSVKDLKKEKNKAQDAAVQYFNKKARINIRISEKDLGYIKQRAAYEGLPYQTLIASILHKYAAGHPNSF